MKITVWNVSTKIIDLLDTNTKAKFDKIDKNTWYNTLFLQNKRLVSLFVSNGSDATLDWSIEVVAWSYFSIYTDDYKNVEVITVTSNDNIIVELF